MSGTLSATHPDAGLRDHPRRAGRPIAGSKSSALNRGQELRPNDQIDVTIEDLQQRQYLVDGLTVVGLSATSCGCDFGLAGCQGRFPQLTLMPVCAITRGAPAVPSPARSPPPSTEAKNFVRPTRSTSQLRTCSSASTWSTDLR